MTNCKASTIHVVMTTVWLLGSGTAFCQIPNCGSYTTKNSLRQVGNLRAVQLIASTSLSISGCAATARVEAWVERVSGTLRVNDSYPVAEVNLSAPVPDFGHYDSTGKHWYVPIAGDWLYLGTTTNDTQLIPPTKPGVDEVYCEDGGGVWIWDGDYYGYCEGGPTSPLVIDLTNHYSFTSPTDGVYFDLDADGQRERVAWTEAGSEAAFLALDRNGNGIIDNGSELFGNHTPGYVGLAQPTVQNGFEGLKMLERPEYGHSVLDGTLTAADEVFSRLMLWCDSNHNGVSEAEELRPLGDSGITGLELAYHWTGRRDRFGNQYRQIGTFWSEHRGIRTPSVFYDVWLRKQ